MGQNGSIVDSTVDMVQYEIRKHTKVFNEINNLEYSDFLKCILDLNELSRKCVDTDNHQLVFALKKGTDTTYFWKATVRIACVKVQLQPRKIERFRMLNLKEFLTVFRTFQTHIEALETSENAAEEQHHRNTASMLMDQVDAITQRPGAANASSSASASNQDECIICLDRKPEVLLACAHSFCVPCIEQWKLHHNQCPLCQEEANHDDEWVLSETPNPNEVNEEICAELMKLSVVAEKKPAPASADNP